MAQCKKTQTLAEELKLPCALQMVSTMIDDTAVWKLLLSNNTVDQRVQDMSEDAEEQLHDEVQDVPADG